MMQMLSRPRAAMAVQEPAALKPALETPKAPQAPLQTPPQAPKVVVAPNKAAPNKAAPKAAPQPAPQAPPPPPSQLEPKASRSSEEQPAPPRTGAPQSGGDFHGCERVLGQPSDPSERLEVPPAQALRRWEAGYFAADAPKQCDYSPGGFWRYEGDPDPSWQQALERLAVLHGPALQGRVVEPADLIASVPDEELEGVFTRPSAGGAEVVLLDCREYASGRGTVRGWGVSEDGSSLVQAAAAVRADCGDPELAAAMTEAMRVPESARRCCRTHAFQDSHSRKVMCATSGTVCGADVRDPEAISRHRRLHARFAEVDAMARSCSASGGCVPAAGSVWRDRGFLEDFPAQERRRIDGRLPTGPSNLEGWRTLRMAYRRALAANDTAFRTQWLSTMGCRGNRGGGGD